MSDSTLKLKPINDLLTNERGDPAAYWIPAYQRGYRWAPLQVTQLLDDIWEFDQTPRDGSKGEFYCLQPLVLSPHPDGRLEVVDGQQRLTTILLILSYFNRRLSSEFQRPLYSIEFETRAGFDGFLASPTREAAEQNVDFFHLFEAIDAIAEWFKDKSSFVNDVESALLNRTKVIWFQLADGDEPVQAFTRLNVGKIPLTNDELIRALFLRREGCQDHVQSIQLHIAYEWDLFEKSLQRDSFWCFLTNETEESQNRIGFLFKLIVESGKSSLRNDDYSIFYEFNDKLKVPGSTPEGEWLKIKRVYMTLEEWFEDRFLFHVVGFLVNEGRKLPEILKLSEEVTKSEFCNRLKQLVFKSVTRKSLGADPKREDIKRQIKESLLDLEYGRNSGRIRSVLLLFNLATLLSDDRSNIRFQFDSFKREKWDIEHIRSVSPERPDGFAMQSAWLENCRKYFDSQNLARELQNEIAEFVNQSSRSETDDVFDSLYEKVLEHFKEAVSEDSDNGVENLTLLDAGTNRSYKNAVFAIKRLRLISLDQAGIFVPICTRNVFLKCYSPDVQNAVVWSKEDRLGYFTAIVETLVEFFVGKQERVA